MTSRSFVVGGVLVLLLLLSLHFASKAYADPRMQAKGEDGSVITIYDEPCKLKSVVSNLNYRALWQKGSERYEGCVGMSAFTGLLVFYFDDKTVFDLPRELFKPVTGA